MKSTPERRLRHIANVKRGCNFIAHLLMKQSKAHDWDKVKTGSVKGENYENDHKSIHRHHLDTHAPEDMNLVDVIEMICDGVDASRHHMPGVSDTERLEDIWSNYLSKVDFNRAVKNTVKLVQDNVENNNPDVK